MIAHLAEREADARYNVVPRHWTAWGKMYTVRKGCDARDAGDIVMVLPVMDVNFCDRPWQVCTLSLVPGATTHGFVLLNDEVRMVTPQMLLEMGDAQREHVAAVRAWCSARAMQPNNFRQFLRDMADYPGVYVRPRRRSLRGLVSLEDCVDYDLD